jgi:hypothetical protein
MEASKDACPICLEGLSKEVSSVDPCNHTFCLDCITKWTEQNANCPLCLKQVDLIKTKLKATDSEDAKEEIHSVKVYPKGLGKSLEEEFECFDHHYFVLQFKTLLKQINDTEFTIKRELGGNRRKNSLERDYSLAVNMKEEIQIKLNYLARVNKISPRDLLEDIQHFCEVLRKINFEEDQIDYSAENYDCYEYGGYEDDNYGYDGEESDNHIYSMYTAAAVGKGVKSKKKNKTKSKNKNGTAVGQDESEMIFG